MRHQFKRTYEINTGDKKQSIFVKQLLSSLVRSGHVTTTPKRAMVLKATADKFFSRLVSKYKSYENPADGRRECIRVVKATILGEAEGKKVVDVLLPHYLATPKQSYIADYKLGPRKGDGAEEIRVQLLD